MITPKKQLVILNRGDLEYLDKLLLQRERATEAHKQDAADWLQVSQQTAAEDQASGYQKGSEGLVKIHCPSAMTYPTNEALLACAEAALRFGTADIGSRVYNFKTARNIYRTTLDFSEAVSEPLSAAQSQSTTTNLLCLDQYFDDPDATQFGCVLRFIY